MTWGHETSTGSAVKYASLAEKPLSPISETGDARAPTPHRGLVFGALISLFMWGLIGLFVLAL